MSATEHDLWSDPVLRIADVAELLRPSGLAEGSVERFLSMWGRVPDTDLPQSCLFELVDDKVAALGDIATFVATARQVETCRVAKQSARVGTSGAFVSAATVSQSILAQVPGLRWTQSQASQASAATPTSCFVLCVGREVVVLVGGAIALAYVDVRDRSLPTAVEERLRQGWNDGELLRLFGTQDLPRRIRRGVWLLADHYLLKPRPEQLIEEQLGDFFSARLRGYRRILRQQVWEDIGRLDLFVETADGYVYIVELKWLGRSVKQKHENVATEALKPALKSWVSDYVTVMNETDVTDALTQLASYMASRNADVGYLAVYDCRRPDLHCNLTHAPAALVAGQHRLLHIVVDPTVPSAG